MSELRGVAQLASARRSGRRGRRFESCHPDQLKLFETTSEFCERRSERLGRRSRHNGIALRTASLFKLSVFSNLKMIPISGII